MRDIFSSCIALVLVVPILAFSKKNDLTRFILLCFMIFLTVSFVFLHPCLFWHGSRDDPQLTRTSSRPQWKLFFSATGFSTNRPQLQLLLLSNQSLSNLFDFWRFLWKRRHLYLHLTANCDKLWSHFNSSLQQYLQIQRPHLYLADIVSVLIWIFFFDPLLT